MEELPEKCKACNEDLKVNDGGLISLPCFDEICIKCIMSRVEP